MIQRSECNAKLVREMNTMGEISETQSKINVDAIIEAGGIQNQKACAYSFKFDPLFGRLLKYHSDGAKYFWPLPGRGKGTPENHQP